MRWYSAIMNRFRYSHIYTQYEKTNHIFKTWFVKHKISSVQSMNFQAIFGIALLCFVHTPTVLSNLRFVRMSMQLMHKNDVESSVDK